MIRSRSCRRSPLVGALFGASLVAAVTGAPSPAPAPVLQAMETELTRSLEALRAQPTPPYFLSYSITEVQTLTLAAAFGAITERHEDRRRALDVDVRVGSYAFDNTHDTRGDFPDFADFLDFAGSVGVPIDDDPLAIRAALWTQTGRRYRAAVARLGRVRAGADVRVAPEDASPDFSREPPERYSEPLARLTVDRGAWERKIRAYTAPFARHADVYGANAVLSATIETRWYVNSDGAEIQTSRPTYRLLISAYSKADDGMELPRYESFYASTPDGLPADQIVLRAVDRMIADLGALRRAPLMEPYTGPAILSGRASAVFFHEILGHRLEGHRQKREAEGQTFTRRVNDAILPPGFSVYVDPTLPRLGGTDLAGFYRYDDEGVRARRVPVIEHGVLKTFLLSRAPIEGFAHSNGHGRRQVGFASVARQSNLILEVAEPRTRAWLKELLIEQLRRDRKPFGLFFDDIEGGFTITTRGFPNAFEVLPIMVYRVFPDGREELVRGVDLIGTPLTVFSKVAAADDQVEVFNGLCGAESGFVPVSAVSPGVFISQIEVQKKPKSTERGPILAPPAAASGADTGDVILRAMRDELARSMAELRLDTLPRPYFIAYRVDELASRDVAATLGSLVVSGEGRHRRVSVELHVGDNTFDNSNFFGAPTGRRSRLGPLGALGEAPLDDDYGAFRRAFWLATDASYKEAVENIARKRATLASRMRRNDVADFSREAAVTLREDAPSPRGDRAAIEALVRTASAVFRSTPDIYESGVAWSDVVRRTWYVNSEGTSFVRVTPTTAVHLYGGTQATDGAPLRDAVVAFEASPADLRDGAAFAAEARRLAARLAALRRVPPAEPYLGPVLFEGEAAAQLVSRVLAPALVAERHPLSDEPMFEQFMERNGDGLLDQLGRRILPRFLSVTDDPSVRRYEGRFIGGYLVDDDGVPARATKVVERGILRTLLTTRVPVPGIPRSTGNRWGDDGVATNLFVTVDSGLTADQLRQRLLALAAERGAPYAVVVRRIGDPTVFAGDNPGALLAAMESRAGSPTLGASVAVKLFADGHEEPIRNANITGLGTAAFRDIIAASQTRALSTNASEPRLGNLGAFAMSRSPAAFFFFGLGSSTSCIAPSLLFDEVSLKAPAGDGAPVQVLRPPWTPER